MQRPRNNARLPGDRVIFSMFDEVFGRPVISNPDPQFARSLNDYRLMIEEGGTEPRRMFADLRDRQMNIQQELEDVRSDTTNIRYDIGIITSEIQGLRDDMGAVLTRMEEAARNYETIVQIGADITRFGTELTHLKTTMKNFVSVCSSSLQQSQPPAIKDNSKEVPKLAPTIAGSSRAVRFADLSASHSKSDEEAPKPSSQLHHKKNNKQLSSRVQRPIADSPASPCKTNEEAPKELRKVPKHSPTIAGSSRAVRFADLPASHSRSDEETPKASSQPHREKKSEQKSSNAQKPIADSPKSPPNSDKEAPKELPKVPKHSPTIAGSSSPIRFADSPQSPSESDEETLRYADSPELPFRSDGKAPKLSSQSHRKKKNEQQISNKLRRIDVSPQRPPSRKTADDSDKSTTDEECSDEKSSDEWSSVEESSDEESSDEKTLNEKSSDEESSDEKSSDEESSDEKSSDEESSDEKPSDEESSAEEISDQEENPGPSSSALGQKERDEPHSSSKRKRCDSSDSRKKSKSEKPTVSTHSSSKGSDSKGRVAPTFAWKQEGLPSLREVKRFIRSLHPRNYCAFQDFFHSLDPRYTREFALECPAGLMLMQLAMKGISELPLECFKDFDGNPIFPESTRSKSRSSSRASRGRDDRGRRSPDDSRNPKNHSHSNHSGNHSSTSVKSSTHRHKSK